MLHNTSLLFIRRMYKQEYYHLYDNTRCYQSYGIYYNQSKNNSKRDISQWHTLFKGMIVFLLSLINVFVCSIQRLHF